MLNYFVFLRSSVVSVSWTLYPKTMYLICYNLWFVMFYLFKFQVVITQFDLSEFKHLSLVIKHRYGEASRNLKNIFS